MHGFMPWRAAVRIFAKHEFLYSICFFIGIYYFVLFVTVCLWSVIGRLGHWVCRESWASKTLFNLLPQFSRLGTQGPASHCFV